MQRQVVLPSGALWRCSAGALTQSRRWASTDLTSSIARLKPSSEIVEDVKNRKMTHNKEITETMQSAITFDEVQYKKRDRPWDLVPKYAKRRVSDMVGVLTSRDRMEIEMIIDRMQGLCDTDMYVVIVPTVGYVKPRVFAQSIFFDWSIGEPKGNGLLLVISQHEANVQLISGLAFDEYYSQEFTDRVVSQVMQPLIKERGPSYAILQLCYAIAEYSHMCRHNWQKGGLITVEARAKVRFAEKTFWYGVFLSPYFYGALILIFWTVVILRKLMELKCDKCGSYMSKATTEENILKGLDEGQRVEHQRGCADYRVYYCNDCKHFIPRLILRDLYNNDICLQCPQCRYYTTSLNKEVVRLPTKTEDGLKRLHYECGVCGTEEDVMLPLLHPLESEPKDWYSFLLDQAQTPAGQTRRTARGPLA